jgi:1-acyl-sn-glycerol-3-phosphate acyltransferase
VTQPVRLGCPRRGTPFSRRLATRLLALFGWHIEGTLPDAPRFVLIVAPHTSNWDFFVCIAAMFAFGIRLSFLGKHTIFFWPARYILRWLGGEPVDRNAPVGAVEHAIARFQAEPQWVMGLSPEGTRKRTEEWKSGFYRIAVGAGVPILPVALDYQRRVVSVGTLSWPTGDADGDIATLRAPFHSAMARHPAQFAELPPSAPPR